MADLQPPELEVRLAILRKRAALDSLNEVSEETLAEIAARVLDECNVIALLQQALDCGYAITDVLFRLSVDGNSDTMDGATAHAADGC